MPAKETETFVEELFEFLASQKLLVPVKLKGAKGRPLPGVTGLFQVDADRLRLQQNHGVWRCRKLPAADSEADATPEVPRVAVLRRPGVRARGSGQLRSAAPRSGLLDASARGTHGDGSARRA